MAQGTTKGVPIDTDPTLAADSDQLVASQAATKTYVDAKVASGSLPVTATNNLILLSVALGAPVWSLSTYPSSAGAAGNVLTSDGTNFVSTTPAPAAGFESSLMLGGM